MFFNLSQFVFSELRLGNPKIINFFNFFLSPLKPLFIALPIASIIASFKADHLSFLLAFFESSHISILFSFRISFLFAFCIAFFTSCSEADKVPRLFAVCISKDKHHCICYSSDWRNIVPCGYRSRSNYNEREERKLISQRNLSLLIFMYFEHILILLTAKIS